MFAICLLLMHYNTIFLPTVTIIYKILFIIGVRNVPLHHPQPQPSRNTCFYGVRKNTNTADPGACSASVLARRQYRHDRIMRLITSYRQTIYRDSKYARRKRNNQIARYLTIYVIDGSLKPEHCIVVLNSIENPNDHETTVRSPRRQIFHLIFIENNRSFARAYYV